VRRPNGGLPVGDTTWELPTDRTIELIDRIRRWYDGRSAPGCVIVRDGELRLFVWRLLSVWPERVAVFSQDELAAAAHDDLLAVSVGPAAGNEGVAAG
jgi:hypothetical protein